MEHLRTTAQHLHSWGANINLIRAGSKAPSHKWDHWQTERQNERDLNHLPWKHAVGIGIVNGVGGWHTFDLDPVRDAQGNIEHPVTEADLDQLLAALGLPPDYAWVWRSGSGAGWGLAIRCNEPMLPEALPAAKRESGVFWGYPAKDSAASFEHIELRWAKCQSIVPPSAYTFGKGQQRGQAGPGYRWRGAAPSEPPAEIGVRRIISAFYEICPPPAHTLTTLDDLTRQEIRRCFDLASYASRELGSELQHEGNEVRVLGHGGLLIKPETGEWYCHSDQIGGDCFDLVAWVKYGVRYKNLNGKGAEVLRLTAEFAGITLPLRRPVASSTVQPTETAPETAPSARNVLRNEYFTDTGNAHRLLDLHGDDIRYVPQWKRWIIWNGHYWEHDETGEIMRRAISTIRTLYQEAISCEQFEQRRDLVKWALRSESLNRLESMIKLTKTLPGIPTLHTSFDTNRYLLNVQNGTIDLRSGNLLPHQRHDLISKMITVDYDAEATCPTWLRFLDRIFGGDQALIQFIQRAVGYSFTGDVSAQCMFFCHGNGANGKTTFLETLMDLLGNYAQKAPTEMLMSRNRSTAIPNDIARLPGARFVVCSEVEMGRTMAESIVKDLTGDDKISARFLYGEWFQFQPTHHIWMYGNYKPRIRGADDGIWRRIITIPFDVTIPAEERDPKLREKLRAELPGILAWAVAGSLAWQHDGLNPPERVVKANNAYRNEMDLIAGFLTDRCILGEGYRASATPLYEAYVAWCAEMGEQPVSQRVFGQDLTRRGIDTDRDGVGRTLRLGVGLLVRPETIPQLDNAPAAHASAATPTDSPATEPVVVPCDPPAPAEPHPAFRGQRPAPPDDQVLQQRLQQLAPDLADTGWVAHDAGTIGYRLKHPDGRQTSAYSELAAAARAARALPLNDHASGEAA